MDNVFEANPPIVTLDSWSDLPNYLHSVTPSEINGTFVVRSRMHATFAVATVALSFNLMVYVTGLRREVFAFHHQGWSNQTRILEEIVGAHFGS